LTAGCLLLGLPFAATAQVKIGTNPTQIVNGAELQINGNDQTSTPATLIVNGTGNVGIGNANPAQVLDVTGNVKFSGALMPAGVAGTSGQVLTSAGAGTAPTWGSIIGVTLTTTGTSGAATLSGSALNIPTTVNDQAASKYIDIGTVRIQWGRSSSSAVVNTIPFPAAFKDTSFSFTMTPYFDTANSADIACKAWSPTTTTITVRCNWTSGDVTTPVYWQAIGPKP
jgi:hypothetical protein